MKKHRAGNEVLLAMGALLAVLVAAPLPAASADGPGTTRPALRLAAAFAAPPQHEAATAPEHAAGEPETAHGTEAGAEHGAGHGEEHSLLSEILHWFNFVLLLGGLWYFGKKVVGPYFDQRARQIREEMDRSAKALADAEQRLAAVEDKLRCMSEEFASLRESARRESEAERQRIEQAAEADAAKLLALAEQEMEAAMKTARQELKAYAAELAVSLAERKIRESLSPAAEQGLLQAFLRELAATAGNGGARGASLPRRPE